MLPTSLLPPDVHVYIRRPAPGAPSEPPAHEPPAHEPSAHEPPAHEPPALEPSAPLSAPSPNEWRAPTAEVPQYSTMTRTELRAHCERLRIAKGGNKEQLVARLVAVDA